MHTQSDPRMQQIHAFRRLAQEKQTSALRNSSIGLLVGRDLFVALSVGFGIVLASNAVRGALGSGAGTPATTFAILCPSFLLVAIAFFFVAGKLAPPLERLRTGGIPGRATFIEVNLGRTLGIQHQGSSFVQSALELEVAVDGRPPYRVVHKSFLPISAYPKLVPGAVFPVRVDRNDPSELLVEWDV